MDRTSGILQRLMALHPHAIDLSLDRILRLLEVLGRPDLRLPPVIHVAGTNGKGSVTAFLRAMIEAGGKRAHVYTSPHLVNFNERIRIGGAGGSTLVDEDILADALIEVERANAGSPITHFEITTTAALLIFAEHPADYTLLEVGLGGRLDATNVVADPLVSVITPISIDHERYLGNTLAEIAAEKAGIIKDRRPVVVAPQPEAALAVIEREAALRRASLHVANQDWSAFAERGRLVFQDTDGLLDLPPPRLIGRHQYTNAGTAIATARVARLGLPTTAIEAGLQNADWPARMQRLTSGNLVDRAGPAIAELWLDGGHNPGAGAVIAEAIADLEERAPRPLYLIAGMLSVKNPTGFLTPFAGLARAIATVPIGGHESFTPDELVGIAREAGIEAFATERVEEALDRIAAIDPSNPPRVLICGSLYLAGRVLDLNGTPPR